MNSLPQLLIRGHLGLGDHILCNAIYRHYATTNWVYIACKEQNVPSLTFMLRDLPNATVLPMKDDAEADAFCRLCESKGQHVLRLGMFGAPPYSGSTFDVDTFRQAGLPFEARWTDWHVVREPRRELPVPPEIGGSSDSRERYIFVHEDDTRGFIIEPWRLPSDIHWVFARPMLSRNIFDWCSIIENATEIHVIDSCFAILADSLPSLKARRKVVHLYARPGALPPQYREGWGVLRK